MPRQASVADLGRNYTFTALSKRNVKMESGEAARLTRIASTLSRPRSASQSMRRMSVTSGMGMTEEEFEAELRKRTAKIEIAALERYERELTEMQEREAAAVIAKQLAQHERDAARLLASSKQRRILELEDLVGSLAQRFLFTPAAAMGLDGASSSRPAPIPVMVNGKIPHSAVRPEARPADFSSDDSADKRLLFRLRDAIAAFERGSRSL
jgi:hypothetical protein